MKVASSSQTLSSTESQSPVLRLSTARLKAIAFLRICFGIVWAIAASLKWQPAFLKDFLGQVTDAMEGQPALIKAWISFWAGIVSINPSFFGILVACIETALAICFIFGIFTNTACVVGMLLSLGIWSVAEGFGSPYTPGKTVDVGTALPYALLCGVLLFVAAGRAYGVDRWLTPRLGRFGFLASGSLRKRDQSAFDN